MMRPLRSVRRWARRSSTDFFRSYPDPPPVTDTNNRHQAISPLFSSPIPCSSVTPRILPVRDCCSPAKKSSAEFPFRRTIFLCLKSLELRGQRVDLLPQRLIFTLQTANFVFGVDHIAARLLFHLIDAAAQELILAVERRICARREDAPEDLLDELPFLRCRAVEKVVVQAQYLL